MIWISQFMTVLGFSLFIPFLPIYLQVLGVNEPAELAIWTGVVLGVAPLTAAIGAPFWGTLADRYGPKPMLIRAQICGGIVVFLMAFTPGPWWLLGLRFLQGLLGGNMGPTAALAANVAPPKRIGLVLGLIQMAVYGGSSFGPLIGGVMVEAVGIRWCFIITATTQIVAAILNLLFVHQGQTAERKPGQSMWGELGELMKNPTLLAVVSVAFALYFSGSGIQSVLTLFIQDLHEAGSVPVTVGLIFAIGAVASAASAVTAGRLSDMLGHRRVLVVALAVAAIISFPQALVQSSNQLMITRFFQGLALGGGLPIVNVLAAQIGGIARRSAAIGLAQASGSLGMAIGPFIGSGLAAVFGLRAPFLMVGLVLMVATFWALAVIKPGKYTA